MRPPPPIPVTWFSGRLPEGIPDVESTGGSAEKSLECGLSKAAHADQAVFLREPAGHPSGADAAPLAGADYIAARRPALDFSICSVPHPPAVGSSLLGLQRPSGLKTLRMSPMTSISVRVKR